MKLDGSILTSLIVASLFITTICHSIALMTPYWLKAHSLNDRGFSNLGLWSACFERFQHPHEHPEHVYWGCHGLSSEEYANIRPWLVPYWLTVCQTFAIISIVTTIATIVLSIATVTWSSYHGWDAYSRVRLEWFGWLLLYITAAGHFVHALILMSILVIFADNSLRKQDNIEFWLEGVDGLKGYGLSFSWVCEAVACCFDSLTASLFVWFIILKKKDDI